MFAAVAFLCPAPSPLLKFRKGIMAYHCSLKCLHCRKLAKINLRLWLYQVVSKRHSNCSWGHFIYLECTSFYSQKKIHCCIRNKKIKTNVLSFVVSVSKKLFLIRTSLWLRRWSVFIAVNEMTSSLSVMTFWNAFHKEDMGKHFQLVICKYFRNTKCSCEWML